MITISPNEYKELKETYLKTEEDFEFNIRRYETRPRDNTLMAKLGLIALESFSSPVFRANAVTVLIFRAIESDEFQIKSDTWLIKQAAEIRNELHLSVVERFPNYHEIEKSRWPQSLAKAVGTLLLKRGYPSEAASVFRQTQIYFPFWTYQMLHITCKCLILRIILSLVFPNAEVSTQQLLSDVKQVLDDISDIQERWRWSDNFIPVNELSESFAMLASMTEWYRLASTNQPVQIPQLGNEFFQRIYNEFNLFADTSKWTTEPSGLLELFPAPPPFPVAAIAEARTKWRWRDTSSVQQEIRVRDTKIANLQQRLDAQIAESDRLRGALLRIEQTAKSAYAG